MSEEYKHFDDGFGVSFCERSVYNPLLTKVEIDVDCPSCIGKLEEQGRLCIRGGNQMKIEEAMKKATPGIMRFRPHAPGGKWHGNHEIDIPTPEGESQRIRTVTCATKFGYDHENNHNNALLAHWYNNGPLLLEVLQGITDALDREDGEFRNTLAIIKPIIAAASEVDGI